VLHAEGADGPARGDAADGVGHVQPDAFLPHHDGADIDLRRVLDQVIDGITREDPNALTLHDLGDRRAQLHRAVSLSPAL